MTQSKIGLLSSNSDFSSHSCLSFSNSGLNNKGDWVLLFCAEIESSGFKSPLIIEQTGLFSIVRTTSLGVKQFWVQNKTDEWWVPSGYLAQCCYGCKACSAHLSLIYCRTCDHASLWVVKLKYPCDYWLLLFLHTKICSTAFIYNNLQCISILKW